MAITVQGNGRFRSLVLMVDTEADIGSQVIVAKAAGYSDKQLEALFGRSRQTLHAHAQKARDKILVDAQAAP